MWHNHGVLPEIFKVTLKQQFNYTCVFLVPGILRMQQLNSWNEILPQKKLVAHRAYFSSCYSRHGFNSYSEARPMSKDVLPVQSTWKILKTARNSLVAPNFQHSRNDFSDLLFIWFYRFPFDLYLGLLWRHWLSYSWNIVSTFLSVAACIYELMFAACIYELM